MSLYTLVLVLQAVCVLFSGSYRLIRRSLSRVGSLEISRAPVSVFGSARTAVTSREAAAVDGR